MWISGQFDGNYDGALVAGHADGLSLRSYTFTVREAVLSGVQPLGAPPPAIDASGLAPLRLPIVRNVHIIYYAADRQPYSLVADLHDFRLHAWDNASTEQLANGRPTLAGRFWGTAYGRLSVLTEPSAPEVSLSPQLVSNDLAMASIAPAVPAAPVPAETTTPAASNQAPDALTLLHPTTAPAQNPLEARSGHPTSSTMGASASALQSSTATPGEVTGGAMGDGARQTATLKQGDEALPQGAPLPTPAPGGAHTEHGVFPGVASPEAVAAGDSADGADPSSPRGTSDATQQRGAGVHTTARQYGPETTWGSQYVDLRRRLWGSEPFIRPRWPLFLGLLGLLFWLVCGWPIMLMGLSALLLQRALHLALFKQRKWPSPRWQSWTNPLLLLVLGLCAFFAIMARSNSAHCLQPSWSWVGLLGVMLLLSALARSRPVAGVIGLLWIVALLMAFRDQDNTCGQSLSQSVRASLQTASTQIERQTNELAAYDQDAEIVSTSATKSQGEQRVSLAQALEHPSRYFSCTGSSNDAGARPVEIYLGESALFGFNSDRLNTEAEANLGKLGALIAHNPHASIVLTGHTDKLGVPLLNIKLSEQRAKRVADWLVTHQVLSADQIDVRGAGDRDPVVDDPALYRMNRRVEMHIDCPEVPSPPVAPSAVAQPRTAS